MQRVLLVFLTAAVVGIALEIARLFLLGAKRASTAHRSPCAADRRALSSLRHPTDLMSWDTVNLVGDFMYARNERFQEDVACSYETAVTRISRFIAVVMLGVIMHSLGVF
jgi:hypothetical protein